MSRVDDAATAFPKRKAHFVLNVHTRWRASTEDGKCVQWARDFFSATAPHAAGTAYVNFMPEDEIDRVRSAYGPNYDRRARAKAQYDQQLFPSESEHPTCALADGQGPLRHCHPVPGEAAEGRRDPRLPPLHCLRAGVGLRPNRGCGTIVWRGRQSTSVSSRHVSEQLYASKAIFAFSAALIFRLG